MVETINFISPSFNNVGNLGCELLMFIKNALIELEDINYGKSRNTLIVNHKNLKKFGKYLIITVKVNYKVK